MNRLRIIASITVALIAHARVAAAQGAWTYAVGPSVAAGEPRSDFMYTLGAMFRASRLERTTGDVTTGLDLRAVALTSVGTERVCLVGGPGSCADVTNRRLLGVIGAGLAIRYERSATGLHPFIGGFLEPAIAVVGQEQNAHSDITLAPTGGLSLGVAGRRYRLEAEGAVVPNVGGASPRVWSLLFGFTP